MVWTALFDDRHPTDPVWGSLVEVSGRARTPAARQAALDAVKATYADLFITAGWHADGFLTRDQAVTAAAGRTWIVELLTRSVLGRPPRLHRPGDECECLADRPWPPGMSYAVHKFLKRNRTRKRVDLDRQKAADLRNDTLKQLVKERDGYTCRYCGSGPLSTKAGKARDRRRALTFDHVDPGKPAGPDAANLVACCARCNEFKGARTPDEADMVLRPEPTADEVAAWAARGMVLRDLPLIDRSAPAITDQINDESPTDHRQHGDPVADPHGDPAADPTPTTAADARPEHAHHQPDHHHDAGPEGPGRGGAGTPPRWSDPDPPGQPPPEPPPPDPPPGVDP